MLIILYKKLYFTLLNPSPSPSWKLAKHHYLLHHKALYNLSVVIDSLSEAFRHLKLNPFLIVGVSFNFSNA